MLVLECNFHVGFKQVPTNVRMTRGKIEGGGFPFKSFFLWKWELFTVLKLTKCYNFTHPNLHDITLLNVTPSLISWNPREQMFSMHISLLVVTFTSHIIMDLDTKAIHQSQTSHCHYCNVTLCYSIMLHVCYIDSLLSHIHDNTKYLLNTTCTLVCKRRERGYLEKL